MISKVLSHYISSGRLLLLLTLLWGGLSGCSTPTPSGGERDNYLSVDLTLRAQADGQNTLNADLLDEEDKVHELRIMLFQSGTLKYNLCYNVPGGSSTTFAFDGNPTVRRAVFRVPKPGIYDMVVIANERVDATQGPTITTALNAVTQRSDLDNIRVAMPALYKGGSLPTIKLRSPMTAEYANVDMTQAGTQATPHAILLPTPTHGVELLRGMAKVELLLKDMVEVQLQGNNQKRYAWIGIGPFDRLYTIKSLNMSKSFPLMPQNLLTPSSEVASGVLFNDISLPTTPNPKCVIDPTTLEDLSIGGVATADYKLAFYIPEYLAAPALAVGDQPFLQFTYKYMSDVWDPTSLVEKVSKNLMQNPNVADARKYLQEVVALRGGSLVATGDYSVYRNSCYRITVRFKE